MKDLISVIVPIYNAQKWLPKCIESILNQTYDNLEIILINDESTDNSLSICKKYASKYSNIVIVDKKNEGVSVARNQGINVATGKYITFMDSDDWYPRNALEELHNILVENTADFCSGKVNNITATSNTIPFKDTKKLCAKKENVDDWYEFVRLLDWAPWGKLFKKSIIDDNNISFPVGIKSGEDSIFNARYLNCCQTVCSTDNVVYYYNRLLENSAVNKYYDDLNQWKVEYLLEIAKMFNQNDNFKSCKYVSFFAIDCFNNVCENYTKCESKDIAIEKLEETDRLFSQFVGGEMVLPDEAKKAQKVKEKYNSFFENHNYNELYNLLFEKANSNESKIKKIIVKIKVFILTANKRYLTK